MKKAYKIEDKKIIDSVIDTIEFGTLALCSNNKPYSLPINYVYNNDEIYFHGAKKGKKIDFIKDNSNASFSIVESFSLLPSYFSNDKGDASPATHLFKSIIIEGKIVFVDDYEQKVQAFSALMQKYQKEGKYIPLNDVMYKKIISATCMYKLIPSQISAKFSFGQNWNKKRYDRVCEHLVKRGSKKDLETLELMKIFHKES